MSRKEIYDAIKGLARSQGSWARVLCAVEDDPSILDELEKMGFSDVVDLVMCMEG